MSALEQYIKSYFGILPEDLNTVVALFQSEKVEKGSYILKTGRHCDKLSFVQSGLMRVFVDTGEKDVTQWISTKGYFVTDLSSFLFQTPARWNIQALSDCELHNISIQDYRQLSVLVPKWQEMEKLFIARCFVMLEDRVFQHISLTAEQRYDQLFALHPEMFNTVPLQYLASMLGMTPETFSRIRNRKRL